MTFSFSNFKHKDNQTKRNEIKAKRISEEKNTEQSEENSAQCHLWMLSYHSATQINKNEKKKQDKYSTIQIKSNLFLPWFKKYHEIVSIP